ncbi:MAG TPA: type II secretion system protein GspL [Noviherbaspirillum sp.]
MSTLYIRLPGYASVQSLGPGAPLYCPYALASEGNRIERDGIAAFSEMGELVKRARKVVLLLAASDVTLLRIKMPPLSGTRLKAALPHLVEDQLMSDPAECVIVAGDIHDGLRTVAVVQRDWLELLMRTMTTLGARKVAALPAQLCLPLQADAVVAAASEHASDVGSEIDLAVRMGPQEGMGVSIAADAQESAAFEVGETLSALVPQSPLVLHVPPARLRDYQSSLHLIPALEQRISLYEDNWTRWIVGAEQAHPDLIGGLGTGAGPKVDWRPWRWPLALAAAVLLVNLIGLNVDWLRMQREAEGLRAAMLQNYRAAFPKDTVIVDPLAQARQKAAAARNASGELARDDFLALTAALAEAWRAGGGQGAAPVASLDYRERALTVRAKPGGGFNPESLESTLASRNLTVEQQADGVWQIRRTR